MYTYTYVNGRVRETMIEEKFNERRSRRHSIGYTVFFILLCIFFFRQTLGAFEHA